MGRGSICSPRVAIAILSPALPTTSTSPFDCPSRPPRKLRLVRRNRSAFTARRLRNRKLRQIAFLCRGTARHIPVADAIKVQRTRHSATNHFCQERVHCLRLFQDGAVIAETV